MGKDKDDKAGSVALFNHADFSRSDAEKIQSLKQNSGMRTMWSYTSLSMLPENQRERAVRRRMIGSNE
jgi:hypothetical protein